MVDVSLYWQCWYSALMAQRAGTLDTSFAQCLVAFWNDPTFHFHHRVLLVRGPAQAWIWLTPDGDVQQADLANEHVTALRRNAPFPPNLAGNIYCFDPVSDNDMDNYLAEARVLAGILGYAVGNVAREASAKWHIVDPHSPLFGEEVPAAALANDAVMVVKGQRALVEIDNTWVLAAEVRGQSWEQFLAAWRSGEGKDDRLTGDFRDSAGKRHADFRSSTDRMKEIKIAGWPLRGERATAEAVLSLRDTGQTSWDDHHTTWVKRSGVGDKSSAAREHRSICVSLRLMQQHDQLNLVNVAGCEYMIRRMRQIEAAVKRSPKQPDYQGLDFMLESAIDETGAMVLPKFDAWVGDLQKAEAKVMAATRIWKDEIAHQNKKEKGGQ